MAREGGRFCRQCRGAVQRVGRGQIAEVGVVVSRHGSLSLDPRRWTTAVRDRSPAVAAAGSCRPRSRPFTVPSDWSEQAGDLAVG